jgi:uncharacterized protein YaaW (UPF0174 family)
MQEFYDLVSAASEEQRQNLAVAIDSSFGSAPETLCNHIRYLKGGSIGQLFGCPSWKQIVTDVADHVGLDWSALLQGRTWLDLATQDIERAVVVQLFASLLETLTPEQQQQIMLEWRQDSGEPHLEGFLVSGGTMLAAKMSGFGVYLLASTVLGSLTNALGLALPFAVYMGMSQAIALVLGPIGWAALAGGLVYSLNQPHWSRLELAVVYVSMLRYAVTEPA